MKRAEKYPTEWHARMAREAAERALVLLRQAREELKYACAPKTTARVRLAITSCGGAIRNAYHRGQS